jgi:hypothetical protein
MLMNTLLGKTLAIWMLTGHFFAGCVFLLVGLINYHWPRIKYRILRWAGWKPVTIVEKTPFTPTGKYRI